MRGGPETISLAEQVAGFDADLRLARAKLYALPDYNPDSCPTGAALELERKVEDLYKWRAHVIRQHGGKVGDFPFDIG
jgi:hypothetical protein